MEDFRYKIFYKRFTYFKLRKIELFWPPSTINQPICASIYVDNVALADLADCGFFNRLQRKKLCPNTFNPVRLNTQKGTFLGCVCKKSPSWEGGEGTFYLICVCVCVSHRLCSSKKDLFYRNIRLLKMLEMQVEHILHGTQIEANISSHQMHVNNFSGKVLVTTII